MSQCLIGFCPLMATTVLKDRGGSALTVMRYSILLHFARAITAIRSLATVGSVDHVSLLSDVLENNSMSGIKDG